MILSQLLTGDDERPMKANDIEKLLKEEKGNNRLRLVLLCQKMLKSDVEKRITLGEAKDELDQIVAAMGEPANGDEN